MHLPLATQALRLAGWGQSADGQSGDGLIRLCSVGLNRSVIVSREFPSSSPYRSFPMLVQFGHLSVPGTRKQSIN